jgi:hypothetical protein
LDFREITIWVISCLALPMPVAAIGGFPPAMNCQIQGRPDFVELFSTKPILSFHPSFGALKDIQKE